MSISVKGLSKIYGTQKAVNDINFEIAKGTIVGFLGPNGAGKSTTMKMLSTYIQPTEGTAKVCDLDVTLQPMEVRKRLGYLPETNPLYFDMYIKEYLEFAAGVHKIANPKQRIDEVIALTGLQKEIKKKIGTLSKGYKQRVGLAQAIIHDPEVLILDEPTSGLDPNQIMDIRDLIINLGKDKTVLLSTHIMQEVEAMCNRIIIINNGNLVADDLISNIQTTGNDNGLEVVFDSEVTATQLNTLKYISDLKPLDNNGWLMISNNTQLLRKELMSFALQNDISIVSLQDSNKSLENAFRNLTRN